MDKEKMRKNKSMIVLLALFVIALAFSGWRNFRKGVYIGDDFFYKTSDTLFKSGENTISFQESDDGTQFTVFMNGEQQTAGVKWNGDHADITYADGTVVAGSWDGQRLLGEDGIPLIYSLNEITVTIGNEIAPLGKGTLSDVLCRIDRNETENRGIAMMLVAGGVLYLIGALTFLYPNETHFFLRRWAYREAELSEEGLLAEKIGGVVAMIAGIIIMAGMFL